MEAEYSTFCREQSSAQDASSYACADEAESLETNMIFANCTKFDADKIGLILADDDGSVDDIDLANTILTSLAKNVSDTYKLNNDVDGTYDVTKLNIVTFDNLDKLKKYIRSNDYFSKQLCFSLSWKSFIKAENKFNLQFDMLVNQQLPKNTLNEGYETAIFSDKESLVYFGTGQLQIMSLATVMIAEMVYDKTMEFELLYTNMATGNYYNYYSATIFCAFYLPLILFAVATFGGTIRGLSEEKHEKKLQWMLRISGMREVVVIMREIIINLAVYLTYGTAMCCMFWFTEYSNNIQFSLYFCFI